MEMKMKMSDVLSLYELLKQIIDDSDSKIDALLKFKLLGVMKAIEQPVANYEKIRNEKILEFGTKDEETGNYSIKAEDEDGIKKFVDAINPIMESNVDLNIDRIKPEELFDKGVSAEYLMGLYPIIEGS